MLVPSRQTIATGSAFTLPKICFRRDQFRFQVALPDDDADAIGNGDFGIACWWS
jgi:hypothetical protein